MNLGPTIEVIYACKTCVVRDIKVTVPARGEGDVVSWVKMAADHCGVDHMRRSPWCPSHHIDLKIPLEPGSDKVGGVGLN